MQNMIVGYHPMGTPTCLCKQEVGKLRSRGLEPAVGLHPALWMVDHTSSTTCHYLPGFYTGTKLYCLVTEAHRCE